MKKREIIISSVIGLTLLTACEQTEQSSENSSSAIQPKSVQETVDQVNQDAAVAVESAVTEAQTGIDETTDTAAPIVDSATQALEATTSEIQTDVENAASNTQDALNNTIEEAKSLAAPIVDSASQELETKTSEIQTDVQDTLGETVK